MCPAPALDLHNPSPLTPRHNPTQKSGKSWGLVWHVWLLCYGCGYDNSVVCVKLKE